MQPPTIVTVRRSIHSLLPQVIFAIGCSAACWFAIDQYVASPVSISVMALGTIQIPFWPMILAFLMIRPLIFIFDCRHRISGHHIRSEWGRLSLHREEVEIAFENLKGVKMQQGLVERLLDIGSIVGWTAYPEKPDLVMHGVRNPKSVLKLIGARVDESKTRQLPQERSIQVRRSFEFTPTHRY